MRSGRLPQILAAMITVLYAGCATHQPSTTAQPRAETANARAPAEVAQEGRERTNAQQPKSAMTEQTRPQSEELVQQAAQRYVSSLGGVQVQEVKFSEWTSNNRSKQEMEEISQIILDSVKSKGIEISDSDATAILRISYEEMSWMRIGGPAGVDYTLTFTLADKTEGDLIRNEYKGTITAEVARATDDQGGLVRTSLGISDTFEEAKKTLKTILAARNPLTTDEKTQYLRIRH